MHKWMSRKLAVTLTGLLLIALSRPLDLDATATAAIGAIVAAYVGGQGYLDARAGQRPAA